MTGVQTCALPISACRTAEEALVPEPARGDLERAAHYFLVQGLQLMVGRLGDELPAVIERAAARARHALPGRNAGAGNPLLCECEMVTLAEILAPGGVYHAPTVASRAVSSCLAISPLPVNRGYKPLKLKILILEDILIEFLLIQFYLVKN